MVRVNAELTWMQKSTVTKKTEMERKRKNMRNQALQCSQLLRPIIRMYSWRRSGERGGVRREGGERREGEVGEEEQEKKKQKKD